MSTKRPAASSDAVEKRMRATRRRDTDEEVAIRRLLFARGLRYRVDHALPGVTRGRPDLAFVGPKVAVFVDGCFWHRCPIHGSDPKANGAWWRAKLDANVARDRRHDAELAAAGWTVLRFWTHEPPEAVAAEIERVVQEQATTDTR